MSETLQERYAAIERQYSQGQWQNVLTTSAALLEEIGEPSADPLRIQLLLLQAHTRLYGLGDSEAAAAVYQQVLSGQSDPLLQTIAQNGLEQCQRKPAPTTPAPPNAPAAAPTETQPKTQPETDFPLTAAPVGTAPATQATAAMPWLEALGGVDPATHVVPPSNPAPPPWLQTQPELASRPVTLDPETVEVLEEPEQIAVQQADPERSEVVELRESLEPEPTASAPTSSEHTGGEPRWSPAEEAELARGVLTVVLG